MTTPHRIQRVTWQQSEKDLADIRRTVFIDEQSVPENLEWDKLDATAQHVLACLADGTPVGCGRLVPVPRAHGRSGTPGRSGGTGRIGRMAVLKAFRRRGIGAALLGELLVLAREQGMIRVVLSAQVHALPFYTAHGFAAYGQEFTDAGIPHRRMAIILPAGQGSAASDGRGR
ncbi:MAG: GNAT family N-acetyltransferase [Nitrospirota bacterium]|nr:GNAT family N-acetyltransferase [Nitrospirota bacterium]